MGIIMKAACDSCGYEKELFTGGGKLDCSLETIMKLLPDDKQQTLSEAVEHGAKRIAVNREPCACIFCGEIYAVPVVSYIIDGEERTVCGACPSCKQTGYVPPSLCPGCGEKLSLIRMGLWD